MTYKIEDNVPLPLTFGGTASKYPFDKLQVGQRFVVTDGKSIDSVRTSAYQAGRRLGMKFATRTVDGGLRVWRVA
jgi:hypothetical protein